MRILTNPRILNEEYYGANNQLKRAEKALDSLKKKIDERDVLVNVFNTEEYEVLKEALCEVFGFSDILIGGGVTNITNAFTIPLYSSPEYLAKNFKDGSFMTKNDYGICFSKEADMVPFLYVDFGMLSNKGVGLTGGEMLAVILHEIGHNFFSTSTTTTLLVLSLQVRRLILLYANRNYIKDFEKVFLSSLIMPSLVANNKVHKIMADVVSKFNKMTDHLPFKDVVVGLYQSVSSANHEISILEYIIYGLKEISKYFKYIDNYSKMVWYNFVTFGWLDNLWIGYDNEKFADNFASTYGYGGELASGMAKMEKFGAAATSRLLKKVVDIDKTGLSSFVINIYSIPFGLVGHALTDCHPDTEQRILGQIKLLKTELKKTNLKPETKKKIEADLEKLAKVEKEYFFASEGDNPFQKMRKNTSRIKREYGGDLREIIRGESSKEDAKVWKQFETITNNVKTEPVELKPVNLK